MMIIVDRIQRKKLLIDEQNGYTIHFYSKRNEKDKNQKEKNKTIIRDLK